MDIASAPAAAAPVWGGVDLSTVPALGRRVGLFDQNDGTEHGVYLWVAEGVPMARVPDLSKAADFIDGIQITIQRGASAHAIYEFTTDVAPTLGTTPLIFQSVRARVELDALSARIDALEAGGPSGATKAITPAMSPYSVESGFTVFILETAAGTIVVNLPAAADRANEDLRFKVTGANTATLAPPVPEQIDRTSTVQIPQFIAPGPMPAMIARSTGLEWFTY